MGTIIALVVLLAIVIYLLKMMKGMIDTIKFNFRNFKRQEQMEEQMEKQNADAILYHYAKDNKIPSWAYDRAVKDVKVYCGRTKHITFHTYMDAQKLEVVPLPAAFKMEPGTPAKELELACVVRIREFDLEACARTGKLQPKDQETMDNLVKMWFFAEPNCLSMEAAKIHVEIIFRSLVPEEYRPAKPKIVVNERGTSGSRYSVQE